MAENLPISFSERMNLSQMGFSGDDIRFGKLTMESDKYICMLEQKAGQTQLSIVDLTPGGQNISRPIGAEAAIMNPVSKVLALRGGQNVQIFNIEMKAKVKSYKLPEGTNIAFWRWITPNTIAMVTQTAVMHWTMDGDSAPVKVFDRHGSLANSQIINYQASADGKWLLLVGISQGANSSINGNMQLYSVDKRVSQPLQGHAGCFASVHVNNEATARNVFCFIEKKPQQQPKLFVMQVGQGGEGSPFKIPPQPVTFAPEAANDFPVSLIVSRKHDILFLITKFGYLFLFDVHTGQTIFRNRISADTIFVTCPSDDHSGLLGITARRGQVLQIGVKEENIVPYILSLGNMNPLAMSLSTRLNLPGAEQLYVAEFNRLIGAGNIKGAATLAASSPQGVLRTSETIQRFQGMPHQAGQPQPVLQYFSTLLEKGKLNTTETIELARPVLQQGRGQMLENWLKEDKLECSEQLGDMVAQVDAKMALSVYLRANAPEKVINCFVQTGEYGKIVAYANKVGYQPDYVMMLQNIIRQNPKGAEDLAKMLVNNKDAQGGDAPLVDANMVIDVFMQVNRIQETTAFLLDALKNNRKEEGYLQTRLLEINLLGGAPQVADAIFASEMFSHYDRPRVAQLCEKAGLFQRALEHYSEIDDIKRVLMNTHSINHEFLVTFFGSMTAENCLDCLRQLLQHNIRTNLNIVVQVATKYSEQLTPPELIKMLEDFQSYEGLYYYCGGVLNFSQDADVHYKYIQAAAKMGQIDQVIRVCRESTAYKPEEVKEFLLMEKLKDPRPLIHVCDRFGYEGEMTAYLYTNQLFKHIEVYVQKVSPPKTPIVVGKLLDLDCNDEFIQGLLDSVRNLCPVDALVEEVEKRNRLKLLQPFLEQRVAEGNTETATHNAIGKIYITYNKEPQQWLANNQFYDSKVIGTFCEKLDPFLAYLAYKRAWGACDDDLIRVTNENELFKDQARYLVERQDQALWASVLGEDNEHRRRLIDETVQTALPETKNPDEVSTTVKAFMQADLPNELIELLEKIVLQGSDFSENKNLQNLLILTAIKADKSRVMDYINRLDNFDGPDIAKIACSDSYELYEEAFVICKKFNNNVDAIDVLLNNIESIERGAEFAERCAEPAVWSALAKAQLDANLIQEAIDSYIKADDADLYREVIDAAEREEYYEDLVKYLRMARVKAVKERHIDTELVYSLAKVNELADLEEFIASPNVAEIQAVGDRCFDEELFEAAKLMFNSINNNAKLASCFVHLRQYREAVEAARKANSVRTWKEINGACVADGEFRLAAICGLNIIVSPDHLEELVSHYEIHGHFEELIKLMEQGLGLEGAHTGIFTELGVLYCKYKPEKLMEHIKIFSGRINIPKLLRACEASRNWEEATYLYIANEEFDQAVRTMMNHPSGAWDDDKFMDCIQKVRNQELYYKAISFYIEVHPGGLIKLLKLLTPSLEHSRVVHQLRKADQLPLAMPYLRDVQGENVSAVNEAVNELLVEEEDFDGLRISIDEHDNFDQIDFAQKIEKHELLEFRRIAAYVYRKNRRFSQSVALSKRDKMYKDAIDTAAESEDCDVVEDLLKYFVFDAADKECFTATLYTCYALVKPDVVMELAWRNGLTDFAMPYLIQFVRDTTQKITDLETAAAAAEQESAAAAEQVPGGIGMGMGMIANVAYNNVPAYNTGMQMGGQMQPMQMGGGQMQMGGGQMQY